MDKYIYGHPKHKDFRSIEQFFSHFCYLALHQEGNLCDCVVCMTGENRERRKAAIAKTSGVRPRVLAGRGPRVKESSPASLPTLSTLLREEGDLDIPIEERQNMVCVMNKMSPSRSADGLVGLARRERDGR